jgi:transposase
LTRKGFGMSQSHYIGLDVSARTVNLWVVDQDGRVAHERKLTSDPEEIAQHILSLPFDIVRVGLEAGMLSQHIYGQLAEANIPVVCVETRHMKAALAAQLNKTDRHDARGIAQIMRVGLFKPVHVKTPSSQRLRTVLTARQLLRNKLQDIENDIRGLIRNFGYHLGKVTARDFEPRVRELISGTDLQVVGDALLPTRKALVARAVRAPGRHDCPTGTTGRGDTAVHDGSRRGAARSSDVPGNGRCSVALHAISNRRRSLRSDTAQAAVRLSRPHRPNLALGRRNDAQPSL